MTEFKTVHHQVIQNQSKAFEFISDQDTNLRSRTATELTSLTLHASFLRYELCRFNPRTLAMLRKLFFGLQISVWIILMKSQSSPMW